MARQDWEGPVKFVRLPAENPCCLAPVAPEEPNVYSTKGELLTALCRSAMHKHFAPTERVRGCKAGAINISPRRGEERAE